MAADGATTGAGDGGPAAVLHRLAADLRPDDPAWATAAARAVADLVATGGAPAADGAGALRPLLAALIVRPGTATAPPDLHHRLAALHAAGVAGVLPRAAALLRPALAALWRAAPVANGTLLMVLLLRDAISWLPQRAIGRVHRARFATLPFADLAIPYNLIFAPGGSRRNRADLARLDPAGLPPAHAVLRAWVTGREAAIDIPGADGTSADGAADAAARRSLAVRHVRPALAPEAAALVAAAAGWRAALPAAAPPPWRGRLLAARPWQALRAAQAVAAGAAPFLRPRGRRPRVAVCLSGQLRGYRAAAATLPRLLAGAEPRFFVCAWRRLGRSGAEPFRHDLPFAGARFGAEYRRLCTAHGLPAFHARYPTLFRTLDDTGRATPEEVARAYPGATVRLDDDEAPPFAGWSNQDKMHRGIEACFDLAAAAGEHDLVVRLRPDKPVRLRAFAWGDLWAAVRDRPLVLADREQGSQFGELLCGDQFAVGAPAAMAAYARTASRWPVIAAAAPLGVPAALTGHVSIAQACWLTGVAVGRAPVRFGPLADPERLSAAAIRACLAADAAGRLDAVDRALIAAIDADLAA